MCAFHHHHGRARLLRHSTLAPGETENHLMIRLVQAHGSRPLDCWWVAVGRDCAELQRSKVSVTRVSCIQAHDYSAAGGMWKSPPLPQFMDGRYPAGLRAMPRVS